MAEYFGVRHFSPACSVYVREFLTRTKPDVVLIEGPSELTPLMDTIFQKGVKLPAAFLAYTQEAPVQTVLYPMVEFSPEYNAMCWAFEHGVFVEFIDLEAGIVLAHLQTQAEREEERTDVRKEGESQQKSIYRQIREVTGLDDDTFWEYHFEQCRTYEDFMKATEEYSSNVRSASSVDEFTMLREAHMRRRIAESENKYGKAAVITGSFHTAGIRDIPYSKKDEELLGACRSVQSKSTLMPYSFYRLSARSGYGAGSRAPGYQQILYQNMVNHTPEHAPFEYLSRIAAYQRKAGFAASSAEVIEAVRLAQTLAQMRGGAYPSMADLRDAAVTCMGHGSFGEISLACADVEIGTRIGELPEGSVCTSVQDDFMRQLKELKLERYRTAVVQELELDLRENLRVKSEKSAFLDLHRSFFLHRMLEAGVHFGEQLARAQEHATWAEKWSLRWSPEIEIQIVEASLVGDSVEQAARNSINLRLVDADTLSATAEALTAAFVCGMSDCVKSAVAAVQGMAADCASPADEGRTISKLSSIVRFGNIRRMDAEPIVPLLEQLYLKMCLQLVNASYCDTDAAEEMIEAISAANDACLAHEFLRDEHLFGTLEELSDSDSVNPLISGFACAILAERGLISADKLSELISRRLSRGTLPQEGAQWFEGFARRNHRSLVGRLSVWEKLCDFIAKLDEEEFKPVLISLRRTFSEFSVAEKADIAENVGEVLNISGEEASEYISSEMTEEEQSVLEELDEFDFDDI